MFEVYDGSGVLTLQVLWSGAWGSLKGSWGVVFQKVYLYEWFFVLLVLSPCRPVPPDAAPEVDAEGRAKVWECLRAKWGCFIGNFSQPLLA